MKQRTLIFILSFLLLASCAHAQAIFRGQNKQTAAVSGSFTAVQTVTGFTGGSATTINLTVTSTGSGNLLVLQAVTQGSATGFISSVTTGCSTSWVVPAGAQIGSPGALSGAYCLASSSGVTSITINFAVNVSYEYVFYEVSDAVGHTPTLDPSGGIGTNSDLAGLNPAGVTLTLTGTNDAIFQQVNCSLGTVTAISAPYGNFNNVGAAGPGWGNVLNSVSGTAPTWTNGTSATAIGSAMAFAAN